MLMAIVYENTKDILVVQVDCNAKIRRDAKVIPSMVSSPLAYLFSTE